MTGGIYLIHNNGQLIEMTEQPYDSEALLQKLLADYPNLLAGDQMNSAEPRRWLLLSRELSVSLSDTGTGRPAMVDHLFLDQEAIPTIVEVKRSNDIRIRRTELRRAVEFLNQQMDPAEVLAIGIKQFVGQNLKALVPRLIGQTAEAQQKKAVAIVRNKWRLAKGFQQVDAEWRVFYQTHLANLTNKATDVDKVYRKLREEFEQIAKLSEK